MPFLLVEILNFQSTAHLIGVGSLSYLQTIVSVRRWTDIWSGTAEITADRGVK